MDKKQCSFCYPNPCACPAPSSPEVKEALGWHSDGCAHIPGTKPSTCLHCARAVLAAQVRAQAAEIDGLRRLMMLDSKELRKLCAERDGERARAKQCAERARRAESIVKEQSSDLAALRAQDEGRGS